ncbi:MAG: Uncharacterised protein [Formosa sp. Hel1_33_131]|nr:MAG: Uncharacterised protein [Formosa sp. Hel1_33_131]
MMMNKRVILITPIIFIFILGCTKNLKESERSWNPYVMNEVIVFESSEKQLDTIVIDVIIDNAVSDGPTPKLYYDTYLIVRRKLKLKENNSSSTDILTISSSTPNKLAGITFSQRFDNAIFAGWGYKLEDLEKYPTISITTKAGTFNDVIKLESVMYRPKRKNSVKFMYWSKKDGYIKFEKADGFTWELIKKYVP